jgi:hypothetical protein
MSERKVKEELAVIRDDRSRRRRAKRGLVAGYIHGLSARHARAGERERVAPAEARG